MKNLIILFVLLAVSVFAKTYNLNTSATTDWNFIGNPVGGYEMASDLMNAIDSCNSVSQWNEQSQGYLQYDPSLPFTDFELEPGAVMVNVTAASQFTVNNDWNIEYEYVQGYNDIVLSQTKTTLQIKNSIPGCTQVLKWNVSQQKFVNYSGTFYIGDPCRIKIEYTGMRLDINDSGISDYAIIYPNPAKNHINITSDKPTLVNVYNSLGQLVEIYQAGSIDITDLATGRYFAQINNQIFKFTIMR